MSMELIKLKSWFCFKKIITDHFENKLYSF